MRKRYFFFDIDGTLAAGPVNSRYIPNSTKRAIEELKAGGHFLAICTGRSHAMGEGFMQELGLSSMVADGGNSLTINGRYLGTEPLEREGCIRVIRECERKGIVWAISVDDSKRRITKWPNYDELIHDSYMQTVVDSNLDYESVERFHKVYVLCSPDEEDGIESLASVPKARFSPYAVFVEPVDKGEGIKRCMASLGAPLEDVVVFGDGSNDVCMFLPEWTSIAMGNAIDELKERASYVTASVDDDGIWKACEHYGWVGRDRLA